MEFNNVTAGSAVEVIVLGEDTEINEVIISSLFKSRTISYKVLDKILEGGSVCFVISFCSGTYRREKSGSRHRNYHSHNEDGRDNFLAHWMFSSFKFASIRGLLK